MGFIIIGVVFYTLTGLISGATLVLVYNWVARWWPLIKPVSV